MTDSPSTERRKHTPDSVMKKLVKCETDEITESTIAKIQEMRECWVGGSTWQGKKVIRISVCSWATTAEDVERSVNSFNRAYAEVMKEMEATNN